MNGPPTAPEDDPGPDQLDRAYRQASARDSARPGPQVRAAILEQARERARPAANDPRWHWRAVAGIAAVGLVGVLSWHFTRVAPPELVARTMPPTPLALQAPSAATPPAPQPVTPPITSFVAAAGAPGRQQEQITARSSGAALPAADQAASALASRAPVRESEPVLRAVRALYPALFDSALPRDDQSPVSVMIVLNADGSVYASARAAPAERAPSSGDAAALIAQIFGSATGVLAQSGVTMMAPGVTVIYGIRAAGR